MVAALGGEHHFLAVGQPIGVDGRCAVYGLISGSWAETGPSRRIRGLTMRKADVGSTETHFMVVGNNFINAN